MWDIECEHCGVKVDDVLLKHDQEPPECHVCKCKMKKCTGQKTSFALKGHGWAREGYTSPKKNPTKRYEG